MVPYGTDLTNLTPTIAHTGASIAPTGVQDFTNSVDYTVTAADGTTKKYTVTITAATAPPPPLSSDKAITSFDFAGVSGTINEAAGTIAATVPYGTNLTSLTPTIAHTGASISPASGAAQDFTNPVAYTVTAADGTTKIYTVTVTVAASPTPPPTGSSKAITLFALAGVSGTINEAAGTIAVTAPYGTNLTSLAPTIAHTGASISPASGAAQDFTNPVAYTVTAADSGTKTYTVTVTVATSPSTPPPSGGGGGSSGSGGGTVTITYTVKFDTDDGSAVSDQVVSSGGKATKPDDPTKEGYTFAGWYSDSGFVTEYDFAKIVTGNISVYAQWTKNIIEVVPITPEMPVNPFEDVKGTDWFIDDIIYIYNSGLMIGTSADPMLFEPNSDVTRGMMVTILYRIEGEPDASGLDNPFDDVPDDEWYTDAVKWGAQNGIVLGYGDGNFGPNDPVTKEQAAALVYRLQQAKGITPNTSGGVDFVDMDDVSDWAVESVETLNAQGLFDNIPGDSFNPQKPATRAEIASILHKYFVSIETKETDEEDDAEEETEEDEDADDTEDENGEEDEEDEEDEEEEDDEDAEDEEDEE
ncbi:MAG: S-layer homology domain-containing protein [Oscillospiraceae bacterium]|nr:S-layer homology domain-containing protein [Oscillospiraceae bacterium]